MSAEITRLRQQVSDLERQIASVSAEARQREERYQQQYRLKIHELERRMQRALDTHNSTEAARVQQQMTALAGELSAQIQHNYDALEQQLTRDLKRRHQALMQQIEAYYERVQRQISDQIVTALSESDEEKTALARQEYARVLETFDHVSERAHEALFPGRLAVHRKTLEQAQQMMIQNQMEASAATSVMLDVKLKDFEYQIDEKISQWLKSYLRMAEPYGQIRAKVDREVLVTDGKKISQETAMHWLDPSYYIVFETLERCEDIVSGIGRYAGGGAVTADAAESYIRTEMAPKARDVEELARMLKYQIPGLLKNMKTELVTAYVCSGQRKEWAGKLAAYMMEKHNTGKAVYDGFGTEEQTEDLLDAGTETQGKKHKNDQKNNEKDLYSLKFRQILSDGHVRHYVFYLVPVTSNGITENHIRLYMDFKQGNADFQRAYENRMILTILKKLGLQHAVVGIGTTPEVLEGLGEEEYMLRPAENGRGEILTHYRHGTENTSGMAKAQTARAQGSRNEAKKQSRGSVMYGNVSEKRRN